MAHCALNTIEETTHLPEIQRFTQKYFLQRTLTRGTYNAVATGYNKNTHQKVIIKSVYKPKNSTPFKEPLILKKLENVPGVIKYFDHYSIKSDIYFIVTENFGQMNLQHFLSTNGQVSEKVAHIIFKQLFTTVLDCFNNNILHRKLKPNNIFIDVRTNQVKIGNFNCAYQCDSKEEEFSSSIFQLHKKVAPPEYFKTNKYTADSLYVWCLGLILYELLYNEKPFNSTDDVVFTPHVISPYKHKLSIDAVTFLNWLLAKSERITLNEIAHHPWITKMWI
jgi:serine/threonine protein kinase